MIDDEYDSKKRNNKKREKNEFERELEKSMRNGNYQLN